MGWLLALLLGVPVKPELGEVLAASALVLLFSTPVNLIGLAAVGLPLTYLGEKLGNGRVWPIVILNGCVALIGVSQAWFAEWPMQEVKLIFWLTMASTSVLFTLAYLTGDRPAHGATHG